MAAPIIQVWQDVLVMPVVGDLDADRAAQMMERLLGALTASRARHAILDLTGVETIDRGTADQLLLRATDELVTDHFISEPTWSALASHAPTSAA